MNAPHNPAQAHAWRKRTAAVFAAVGALIFSSGIVMLSAPAANAADKIGVCHRTATDSNPYRFESVSMAAFNAPKGHGTHLAGETGAATWTDAGTWNGIDHLAGGAKPDYILGSVGVPADVDTSDELKSWCLTGQTSGTLVLPDFEPNGDCGVHAWVSEPSTAGVSYTIEPGDWDVTEGEHTITATLDDRSASFIGDTSGWKLAGKTAKYDIDLGTYAGDCVVGELAVLDWAATTGCVRGHVTRPVDSATVTYSIAPGDWTATEGFHTVTATLAGAATGFANVGDWAVDGNKATQGVDLGTYVACATLTPVTPLEPDWVEAKCTTDPRVDYTSVAGVTYGTAGTVAPGETVTVTASAQDTYILKPGAVSSWTHTFKAKPVGVACGGGGGSVIPDPVVPDPVTPDPVLTLVTPLNPSATDADCSHRGQLVVPAQPEGVVTTRSGEVPGDVTFSFAPAAGYAFPAGTDTEVTVTVERKLSGEDCVLGEETTSPKPHTTKPKPKPRDRAPIVLGTQAAVPTAVDAGLAGLPSTSVSPISSPRLAQALVAGGLLLLIAGGSMGLGRRTRGAHES